MALSFGESLKKVQAETKSAVLSVKPVSETNEIEAYDAENLVSNQPDLSLPYSDKYVKYTEYYDPNFSIIDENKNITLDSSQINLTQEENSQYIPFKMFRRYDNIDQLNMTLLMHCVTPLGGDVYVTPVNVQYDDSYLYFGVIIPASVCATKGEVLFEIQSIGTNEKGDSYKLITRNAKFNVEESLSGNGTVEPTPDTGWMTTFLKQVTEEVGKAQTASNEAKEAAKEAKASADKLQGTIDNAKEELSTSLDTRITTYLLSYYTKEEVDRLLKNIDLTDVYNKINNIDDLAKFNVEYNSDTRTMTFYNGETKIKAIILNTDPSAEWVVSYGNVVDGKISTATAPIQESLDAFKSTVNSDLQVIHKNIDDLPETLKTKYYDKDATNQLLSAKADESDISNLSTKVGVIEQTANSNKSSITAVGTKVASLEDTIGKLSTDPGKTYDATYSEDNIYTLWGTSQKVILKGEYAIEFRENGEPKVKIGNGVDTFANLPYITNTPTEITNAINSAVNAAKHTHSNKAILDAITASFTTGLKSNYDAAFNHSKTAHAPSNAQANVIETVKVNGATLTPNKKAVDVTVPTKVSQLSNDTGFITSYKDTTYKLGTPASATNGNATLDLTNNLDSSKQSIVVKGSGATKVTTDANGAIVITSSDTDTKYSHPNSGVGAGTYKSVTVNAQGHVTAGSNPTTLAGFGISDAYTKSQTDSKISSAVANAGHLKRSIVSALPEVAKADEHTIYMVAKAAGAVGSGDYNGYDEYMLVISGDTKKFEKIGDSAVDLTNYATKAYADQSEADALSAAKTYANGLAKNYATAAQGTKADSAVQSVKIGTTEYKSGTTVTLPAYPTTLPASDVKAWAKAATKPTYTKAEVGLGNVDNTADANKSVKYATSAGSASTASKLGTNAGSTVHPIYFANGVPAACNVSTDFICQGANDFVLDGGGA